MPHKIKILSINESYTVSCVYVGNKVKIMFNIKLECMFLFGLVAQ